MCPSSKLSLHVLSASSEVLGGDQASFKKGVDQANTGDGYVGPTGKQGKNKADITWVSSSTSLSPLASLLSVPRQLCLDELLFDATAGSAATAPPVACGSARLLLDVGRAQRCRLLVVRPCLARDVGHVTNLAMLARLHDLEESNLMYWIFEFGEEEGLMRAIDEMLDRLNFETECCVGGPVERRRTSGPTKGFSSANRKGRSLLFVSRTRWVGTSKGARRVFFGRMVF